MSIATQTDLEQRLQIDFTSGSDPVAASLLAAAQGHIEREVGYPLESASGLVEKFDGLTGSGNPLTTLIVPRRPLTAVASVVEAGITLTVTTDYLFYADGRIIRVASGYETWWRTYKRQDIVVTYTAGYTVGGGGTIPKDLVDLCAQVASRSFERGAAFASMPAGTESVRSVALADSDSVEYFDRAMGGLATATIRPVQLTPEEIAICRHYRMPAVA